MRKTANDFPRTAGVYCLTHRQTGDKYVGSAACIRTRLKSWRASLASGFVPKRFRVVCESHGNDFEMAVLEEYELLDRRDAERKWVAKLKPTLNCAKVNDHRLKNPGKMAISLTLSRRNLEFLEKVSARSEFNPSISQLIDTAIGEFLESRGRAPKGEDKPRKPPR